MYRQVQRAVLALTAGLLFASGELVATTITSTYTEWRLGISGTPTALDSRMGFDLTSSEGATYKVTDSGSQLIVDVFPYEPINEPQDSPVSEGATGALCGGGLLVLFGSLRRKYPR